MDKNMTKFFSVTATIHGTPRPMPRPRFVNGKAFTSHRAKRVQRMIAEQVMVAMREDGRTDPFAGKVEIKLCFIFQRAKANRKGEPIEHRASKPDIDNLTKLVLDACNGVAYTDDAQIVALHAYKWEDDKPPMTIVDIQEVKD